MLPWIPQKQSLLQTKQTILTMITHSDPQIPLIVLIHFVDWDIAIAPGTSRLYYPLHRF